MDLRQLTAGSLDWGPVPTLAAEVAKAAPSRRRGCGWLPVLRRYGGPWELSVVAPGSAGPLVPAGWPRSVRAEARLPSADADALAVAAERSHAWLAARVVDRMAAWIGPFWEEVPVTPLVAHSSQALVGALEIYALDAAGPRGRGSRTPVGAGSGPALLGDLLVKHVLIEDLVTGLGPRLGLSAGGPDLRGPGGLRRPAFLRTWTALSAARASRASRRWWAALAPVVAGSPLTQLVYCDVVDLSAPPEAFLPLVDFDGDAWWHDLWAAHLARSALGALVSGAPGLEDLRVAVARRDRLEAVAADWLTTAGRLRRYRWTFREPAVEHYPSLVRSRQECDDLAPRYATALAGKLASLGRVLAQDRLDFLHLRLVDMLARNVVTRAVPDMAARWRQGGWREPFGARDVLLGENGACMRELQVALFGEPLPDLASRVPDVDDRKALRAALAYLLDLPTDVVAGALAGPAGVPTWSGHRLAARVGAGAGTDGRIPIPFPEPVHDLPAPAGLVSDWLIPLQNMIDVSEATVAGSRRVRA